VPDQTAPVWRFLIAPKWLCWHLFVVFSFWGMLWLGDWQLHRALAGNGLSWAYTFEWPLFSGFAVVFWARTIRDEFRIRRGVDIGPEPAAPDLPIGIAARSPASPGGLGSDDDDDPELKAYNEYLARLNSEVKGHGRWHGLR